MKRLPGYFSFLYLILIFIWSLFCPKITLAYLPNWSSFRADPGRTGSINYSISDLNPLRWKSSNLGAFKAPPVVDPEGNILAPTTNGLIKLGSDGHQIWQIGSAGIPGGPPVFDNNLNLYYAVLGTNPYIYSFDKNGNKRWGYDLRTGGYYSGYNSPSPHLTLTSDKQTLLVGINYPGMGIWAFNLDGSIKWKRSLNCSPDNSAISLGGDGNIYVQTTCNAGSWLQALNSDGTIRWTKYSGDRTNLKYATVIDSDNNIYAIATHTGNYGLLTSINSSGIKRWSYTESSLFGADPALKDGVIYVVEGNKLKAINTNTGSVLWQWTAPNSGTLTSPAIDAMGTIYTSLGDKLFSLNSDGSIRSSLTVENTLGAPIIGGDGIIYISQNPPNSNQGYLHSLGQARFPVIFIPGIGGSELQASQDIIWSASDGHGGTYSKAYPKGESIWVNLIEAALPGEDDYFDVLRFKDDGQTPEAPGIEVSGGLVTLGYPDINDFFTNLGYERGKNFFVYTYDWRKDIRTTEPGLNSLIEKAKSISGMPKVNIVAHSMGGLVARYYITDSNKAQNIYKLIEMGVPHLGAVDGLLAIMYGKPLGRQIIDDFYIGVPASETKDIMKTLTSAFELLPSKKYYSSLGSTDIYPFQDERDIDKNNIVGSLNFTQLKDTFKNLSYNINLFNTGEDFHDFLDQNLNQNNGVKIYEIVGSGLPTLGQIRETWLIRWPLEIIEKQDRIYIDGDGTVPNFSASLKNSTIDLSGSLKTYFVEQRHGDLVSKDGAGMQAVKSILNESDILPDEVKTEKFSLDGDQISTDETLDLYDEDNNHTGLKEDGSIETNIPGTFFSTLGNSKHAFIKKSQTKKVKVIIKSTKKTKSNIKIRRYQNDKITKTVLYKDVPMSNDGPAEFTTDQETTTFSNITVNNQVISPSSEVEGNVSLDSTPPSTQVSLDPVGGMTIVTITASDNQSGVLITEYSLDNGQTIQIYSEPLTISDSGESNLIIKSTDKVGNEEIPQTVKIINPTPTPTPTLTPTPTGTPLDQNQSSSNNNQSTADISPTPISIPQNISEILNKNLVFKDNLDQLNFSSPSGQILGASSIQKAEVNKIAGQDQSKSIFVFSSLLIAIQLLTDYSLFRFPIHPRKK